MDNDRSPHDLERLIELRRHIANGEAGQRWQSNGVDTTGLTLTLFREHAGAIEEAQPVARLQRAYEQTTIDPDSQVAPILLAEFQRRGIAE